MIDLMDQPIVERFIDRMVAAGFIPPLRDYGRDNLITEIGAALGRIRQAYRTTPAQIATVLERIPDDRGSGKWGGWGKIVTSGKALESHWPKLVQAFAGKRDDPSPKAPQSGAVTVRLADGTAFVCRTNEEIAAEGYLRRIGRHLADVPEAEWDSEMQTMVVPTHLRDDCRAMAREMPTTAEADAFFADIQAMFAAKERHGRVPVTPADLAASEEGGFPF